MLTAMSSDGNRAGRSRKRPVDPPPLPPGPLRDLKAAVYELYLEADAPTLDEIESEIDTLADELSQLLHSGGVDADEEEAEVDSLLGAAPRRDTIGRIIGSPQLPPNQQDVVTVCVALARMGGRLPTHTVRRELRALVDQVRRLWRDARTTPAPPPPPRLGKPISECSPLALEVHRAIDMPGDDVDLPVLPVYVPRAHDARLAEAATACLRGQSRMVTLVGGSSTGKTRACWEAIQHLPQGWRLWHPIDPSRPRAAVKAIGEVGPYTVVWLNEAQHYLLTADPMVVDRIAAGLRTLLEEQHRRPVLVLATMWREYWNELTAPAVHGGSDPYGQARELLAGTDIPFADTFNDADLRTLHAAAAFDPRLRQAADHAEPGRITQYLAGVPELLQRYRNAPPAARAIIDVAIDARRLGHPLAIGRNLLERAAPGYLTDHDWHQAAEQPWLDNALAYTDTPSHGVPGPLTRIHHRPGDSGEPDAEPHYRLTDYLEQTGRTNRAGDFPPGSFWDAAATTITDPHLLHELGEQAAGRGRYRRAAQLYRTAADRGNTDALLDLVRLRERAGDRAGAEALARQAADHGNTAALRVLAGRREQAGDRAGAEALARQAADHGNTAALTELARLREQAGDRAGAEALARQAADHGNTAALTELARLREQAGDPAGAEALARQAADHGNTAALIYLARLGDVVRDPAGAEALSRQAADHGNTAALIYLARLRGRGPATPPAPRHSPGRPPTTAISSHCVSWPGCGNRPATPPAPRHSPATPPTTAISSH